MHWANGTLSSCLCCTLGALGAYSRSIRLDQSGFDVFDVRWITVLFRWQPTVQCGVGPIWHPQQAGHSLSYLHQCSLILSDNRLVCLLYEIFLLCYDALNLPCQVLLQHLLLRRNVKQDFVDYLCQSQDGISGDAVLVQLSESVGCRKGRPDRLYASGVPVDGIVADVSHLLEAASMLCAVHSYWKVNRLRGVVL